MRKKIFLYNMILVVIGASITGFFTSHLAQKFYKFEVEEKIINIALLIENNILEDLSTGAIVDYDLTAKRYSKIPTQSQRTSPSLEKLNTRITFIDFKGTVLGESEFDYHDMENHLSRKEIQEAIAGKIGKDTRFSKTLKIDFLYIAIPIEKSEVILRVSVPLFQLRSIDEIIWIYTIIGIFFGLLLTTFLALRFSNSIIQPVNELISSSREIANGNFSKRTNILSNDELGELASTFNEMALKLENNIAEIVDKNVKVESIINSMTSGIIAVDEKHRIILINHIVCEMFGIKGGPGAIGINIIELIRNNQINHFLNETIEKNISLVNDIILATSDEKVLRVHTSPIISKDRNSKNSGVIILIQDITNIKKLEQIKTEFVSNVTHELKTPLTSIRGFIETLRNGAINDRAVADRFLEIIDIEAERLYILINDVLQLSEIENRKHDINIETHSLKLILDEVIPILQLSAAKKGVVLVSKIPENIGIRANKNRIKQMLINLIDNGIKYNVKDGNVTISAYTVESKVTIVLKDTGIGISSEYLPRIFERFYRVDKGRSRNLGGTGLGLSIVKHIVNLYNGDITVKSKLGKGTEFIIRLPE